MANGQVAAGHKANLNNPNTSEESKKHSKAVLNENENENESYESEDHDSGNASRDVDTGGKNPGNVAGGLKATSDEAKESAKERLEQMGEN